MNEKKIKELREKYNANIDKMQDMVTLAEGEERDFTKQEKGQFDVLKAQNVSLKERLERLELIQNAELTGSPEESVRTELDQRQKDDHNFAEYLRCKVANKPYEGNITKGDNGNIIPKTIMTRVIDYIKDRSPIFKMTQRINAKGTISYPKITADNDNITMVYAEEFSELQSSSLKFTLVDLSDYLAAALVLISRSLINNTDLDIVSIVIVKLGDAVADFFEHETLIGTTGKALGLSEIVKDYKVTIPSADAVTIDTLIDLQDLLTSTYQRDAIWVMNKKMKTIIRKLKDKNNRYYFLDDPHNGFAGTLLGNLVYTTDQMTKPGDAKTNEPLIYFVNPREALVTKMVEDFELQVLLETYATKHAIGLVGWTDFDVKLVNEQAAASLNVAASA